MKKEELVSYILLYKQPLAKRYSKQDLINYRNYGTFVRELRKKKKGGGVRIFKSVSNF